MLPVQASMKSEADASSSDKVKCSFLLLNIFFLAVMDKYTHLIYRESTSWSTSNKVARHSKKAHARWILIHKTDSFQSSKICLCTKFVNVPGANFNDYGVLYHRSHVSLQCMSSQYAGSDFHGNPMIWTLSYKQNEQTPGCTFLVPDNSRVRDTQRMDTLSINVILIGPEGSKRLWSFNALSLLSTRMFSAQCGN